MKPTTPPSPKILQKRLLRTAIALLVAAAVIFGYMTYTKSATSDASPAQTKDFILAIQSGERDNHAVLIKPDGSLLLAPRPAGGADDREAVWRPDGNRVFISRSIVGSKDPEESNYQIYRWNPEGDKAERRTIGTRALAHPRFDPTDTQPTAQALATAGGRVLLFDPMKDSSINQILPPTTKGADLGGGEDSTAGVFEAYYKDIGTSFKEARWSPDKKYVVAVLRRENGEALMFQIAQPTTEEERRPHIIACGDRIDFDVSMVSNSITFTVLNFQWQDTAHIPDQYKKDGKPTTPYSHTVAVANLDKILSDDPKGAVAYIDVSQKDPKAFCQPTFSPDGNTVVVVEGAYKSQGEFEPEILVAYHLQGGPMSIVAKGLIYDPSWSPAGDQIVFVRKEASGERDVVTVAPDGTGERSRTAGKGNFAHPIFSPKFGQ